MENDMTRRNRTRPAPRGDASQSGAPLHGAPRDAPTGTAPTAVEAPRRDPWGRWWLHAVRHLGRDYGLILPGAAISLFAFTLLATLFPVAVGLLVVWVGVVLLPATLLVAGWFAELSRARVRAWGAELPRPAYRDPGRGIGSLIRVMGDGRRWLDLIFETIIAFPLRLFTFIVTVAWSSIALDATTYFAWGWVDPDVHSGVSEALQWLTRGAIPASVSGSFPVTAVAYFLIGLVFLATLPVVVHGLALLEAVTVRAGLGGAPQDGAGASTGASSAGAPFGPEACSLPTDGPVPSDGPVPTGRSVTTHGPATSSSSLDAEGWTWLAAAVAAVALLAVGWPVLAAVYGVHPALAMALALAQAAAVPVAVRWWRAGAVLAAAAALGTVLAAAPAAGLPWPWPVVTLIGMLMVVALATLRDGLVAGGITALLGGAVCVLALAAAFLTGRGGAPWGAGTLTNVVVFVALVPVTVLLGYFIRQQAQIRSALRGERRSRAEQDAKRRDLQERNRIARELHDVVAHGMSLVGVQATTAKFRRPDMDAETAAEFDAIAESSRQTLQQMRGILGVLRGGDAAELAPQPGFADIPALIEQARGSGVEVSGTGIPEAAAGATGATWADGASGPAVPPVVGLAAYRIVQEALSNAVRHAPGAAVEVGIEVGEDALRIGVVNGAPDPAQADRRSPGAGLGLRGARERAEALGGALTAAPTAAGGFAVEARLPLG